MRQDHGPWGPWATAGLTLVVLSAFLAAQVLAAMALLWIGDRTEHPTLAEDSDLGGTGIYWAVATLVSAPVDITLIIFFASLRRGYYLADYLALYWPGWKSIASWVLAFGAFAAASDGVTWLIDRPVVPDIMVHAYRTAVIVPLLWVALIVAAPLSEELLFRGFLFRGLEGTALGPKGTILLTSLVWSGIHIQYDLYAIGTIFLVGLLLGYARWRSRSLLPSILMHAFANLVATIQAMIAS